MANYRVFFLKVFSQSFLRNQDADSANYIKENAIIQSKPVHRRKMDKFKVAKVTKVAVTPISNNFWIQNDHLVMLAHY